MSKQASTARRSGGAPVWLVAGAGSLLTAAFFYPGYLNGDSAWQYRQGLSGEYNDMHPVVMSWLWSQLNRVIEGSGGLFLLMTVLFWTGLAMFMRACTERTGRLHTGRLHTGRLHTGRLRTSSFLAATFVVGLSPPVFSMLSQIQKDVGMVTGLLLGYALLGRSDRKHSLSAWILALAAFWYAVSVRHNGVLAFLPFAFWMSFLLTRDHLPAKLARRFASPLREIVLALVIVVAMLGSSNLASRAILGDKGVHYPYQQFLYTFDILGISVRTGQSFFPSDIYYGPPFTMKELRTVYNSQTVFPAYWPPEGTRDLGVESGSPRVAEVLSGAWVEALRSAPVAYAQHRADSFVGLLGVGKRAPWRKLEFTVEFENQARQKYSYDYRGPTVFGLPHNRWLTGLYESAGGLTYAETSLLFRPWPYLLLSLLCMLRAWRARSIHLFHIALLGTSSFAYTLPHLVIGISAELRYLWWPILVSLLQAMLLLDEVARRRVEADSA